MGRLCLCRGGMAAGRCCQHLSCVRGEGEGEGVSAPAHACRYTGPCTLMRAPAVSRAYASLMFHALHTACICQCTWVRAHSGRPPPVPCRYPGSCLPHLPCPARLAPAVPARGRPCSGARPVLLCRCAHLPLSPHGGPHLSQSPAVALGPISTFLAGYDLQAGPRMQQPPWSPCWPGHMSR